MHNISVENIDQHTLFTWVSQLNLEYSYYVDNLLTLSI